MNLSNTNIDELNNKISEYIIDGSIYSFEHKGNIFWLKTQGEEKKNNIRVLSTWLANFSQLSFFSVNSVLSSAERMQLEISHLQEMSKNKLPVPMIILKSDTYFLTPDCGTVFSDTKLVSQISIENMRLVFKTLAKFHNKGCYHGRPALRDIALGKDGTITFLDLEESGVNSNTSLMARDVFLLLTELKRIPQFTINDKMECLQAWANSLDSKHPLDELRKIHRLIRKLSFLAKTVLFFKQNTTSVKILDAIQVLDKFYEN